MNKDATTIARGATETLVATLTPYDVTEDDITWTSSATGKATVSNAGVVTGVAAGTAVITATTENNLSASCTVTVTA